MTTKLEQAARELLEAVIDGPFHSKLLKPAYKLREALAEQTEQEPIGEVVFDYMGVGDAQVARLQMFKKIPPVGTKLYAAPVRTKDLTDDEINELWDTALMVADPTAGNLRFKFARTVIAAYKAKNNLCD